jgi:septation ring formation regulator EzrA
MDQLQDDIDGKKMSNLELELFKSVGFAAVDSFRKASQDIVAEVSTNYGQQIDLLEVDTALLKDQLDSATKQLQEAQDKLRRVQESIGTERSDTDA